jgi:uncharacterized protein with HEPN domain
MDEYGLSSIDRLEHISKAGHKILKFCEGKNESDFLLDDMLQSSVIYQFLIIGEAIQFVEQEILKKNNYPWHLPRSFRNYIAHEYFGINLRRVYKTITDMLPGFITLIDDMIRNEKETTSGRDRR